jgi:predicted nucleic acid-binding protein
LIHAGDADHLRAVQFARSFTGRLITTWPVLTEVAYLLVKANRRGIGVLLGMILDGHLSVADLDSEDVRYMRTLTAKYESMDLADASLVAAGERLGVLDVIALDRRDFSRYRTRSRQAFTNHFPERT